MERTRHTVEDALALLKQLSELYRLERVANRPKPEDFNRAEKALGFPLPLSYKKFHQSAPWHIPVSRWTGGHYSEFNVVPTYPGQEDIVAVNMELRKERSEMGGWGDQPAPYSPLPPFLIAIDYDEYEGECYCFDARKTDERGEQPLVTWDVWAPSYLSEIEPNTGELIVVDELKAYCPDYATTIYSFIRWKIREEEERKQLVSSDTSKSHSKRSSGRKRSR